MEQVHVEKLTLNIGAGTDQGKLEKGVQLLEHITGTEPVKTHAKKRVPEWGLRPGLPIGCKLTLRGEEAEELIADLLEARENELPESCFDDHGNISFGIKEYIDIGDIEYNPDVGMMGLQVSITLERPGYRIKKRRTQQKKVPDKHRVDQDDAITFMEDTYGVTVA
jgi:large subunit ribosomal protein L5